MKNVLFITIPIILLTGCSDINKDVGLRDDNFAEEVVEDIIREGTGVDLDLTPVTPENDRHKDFILFNSSF